MTDRPEWDARRSAWEAERLGPAAARAPERRTRFSTISDMEVERLYGPWSWREGAGGPTELDHHGDPLRAAAAERGALRRFGEALGMAFQIVDDLLDYTEDTSVTGKPFGSDLREHKVTLPLIAALPKMDDGERRAVSRLLLAPEPSDEQIAEVMQAVARAGGLEYARERALRLAQVAEAELDVLPSSAARDALRASITYVIDRRR